MDNMGQKFRFKCSKILFGEFTKLRKQKDLSVNDFLYSILLKAKAPHDYQIDYHPNFNSIASVTFDQRLDIRTIQKFKLFASSFKSYFHALDFLIENEKKEFKDLTDHLEF